MKELRICGPFRFRIGPASQFDVVVTTNMFGDILSDEAAVDRVLSESKTVTPDLGGEAETEEMGKAICEAIEFIDSGGN